MRSLTCFDTCNMANSNAVVEPVEPGTASTIGSLTDVSTVLLRYLVQERPSYCGLLKLQKLRIFLGLETPKFSMGATSVMRMGGQHSPETGHRLANQARY